MPSASFNVTTTGILPRFLYNFSVFDGATLTTNSAMSTLPVTNLQDNIVRRPWRTAGTTQMTWALFDLGTATAVNIAALFGHNLTSVALITLQANSSNSWGSPPFAVGMTIPADTDSGLFEKAITFASATYRYWRLIVNGAQDGTYWDIGRFVAGSYFQPTLPQDIRTTRTIIDPSVFDQADGQQVYSRHRDMFYRYNIQMANLGQSDRDKWLALFRSRGNRLPLVCAFDPTHTHRFNRDTIYGRMTTQLNEALIQMEYGSLNLTFDEIW